MMTAGVLAWSVLRGSLAPVDPVEKELEGPQTRQSKVRPVREVLSVIPGATCLEVGHLVGVIGAYLRTTEVDARVEVEVVGDEQDVHSLAYTVRRDGEVVAVRRFDAAATDCDQLHAVVGVSVALAIDATVLVPQEAEPVETKIAEVETPKAPRQGEDTERAPELEARPREREADAPTPWRGAISMQGGVAVNAPPEFGGLGSAAAELRWLDFVDLSAGVLGVRSNVQSAGAGRAVFSLVGAKVDLCGAFVARRLRPRACAGFIGGGALATGSAFAQPQTARLPWVAGTFSADLRVSIAPKLELELGADGLVHILQPAFDFVDETGARRVGREFPWVGGWITAGLVVSFR